jgi:prepilin-type N-terminal cleavage/methylation domain-containing protein
MKKAFTLIEVIVVLAILPVMTLVLSRMTMTFFRELPDVSEVVHAQTTVLDLIASVHADMLEAVALPDAVGERQSDEQTLLIALSDVVVAYERQQGEITRTVLDRDGIEDPQARRQWRMPKAVVSWQRWKGDAGQAQTVHAVEIHSYVQQWVDGHLQEKLAQSRVYFVDALGKVREVQ